MSLEQLSNLAQVVRSVGVMVSSIFVGLQIKHNTGATGALQRNERNATIAQWMVTRMSIVKNRDIAELPTAASGIFSTLDPTAAGGGQQTLATNGVRRRGRTGAGPKLGYVIYRLPLVWKPGIPRAMVRAESQIGIFLGKYAPAIELQLREARARLRSMFPRGFELVFDNYSALVFGISPTVNTRDAFLSVVGYPKWVTLFFLHGADLRDPKGLLEGRGKQVRSIHLKEAADINTADVEALIAQAVRPHASVFVAAPALETIIRLVVPRQRPRRPVSAA